MTTRYYDKKGNFIEERVDTVAHPLGNRPRDSLGRPTDGPNAGEWEPGSPDAPELHGTRANAIVAAIGRVSTSRKDDWTVTGKPKVEALEKLLGHDISRAERDAVWAHLNPSAEPADDADAVAGGDGVDAAVERANKIVAAIRELDPNDATLWTASDKPKLEVLEAKLGFKPTSEERDAAHAVATKE